MIIIFMATLGVLSQQVYSSPFVLNGSNTGGIKTLTYCGNEFWQTPDKHLQGRGCPFCSSTRPKSWDDVLNEFMAVHSDEYDYSKADFKNMNTKICIGKYIPVVPEWPI